MPIKLRRNAAIANEERFQFITSQERNQFSFNANFILHHGGFSIQANQHAKWEIINQNV